MAYTLYYTADFNNENRQDVHVRFYKKDGDVVEVESYPIAREVDCTTTDNGEDETKDNWIVIRQIVMGLFLGINDSVTWETFVSSQSDEWLIVVDVDGQPVFEGFIVPDEGEGPFLDKPYVLSVKATNNLALLKNIPLSDVEGNDFTGDHTLIEYIAGALQKTLLNLPIRVRCNILYGSMLNKADGLQNDMFNQTYLNYRTFKKDPATFISCYDALKFILAEFCILEYWNGMWQITCLADRQAVPGDYYYVDYDSNGENPVGAQDTENFGLVGKSQDIYPIHADAMISCTRFVKSVKTSFPYIIVPDLHNNEGLRRLGDTIPGITGPVLDIYDDDKDEDLTEVVGSYQGHELVGWVHKKQFLDEVDPITNAYIRVDKDLNDKEVTRYYVVERDDTTPVDGATLNYIRNANTDFYVKAGDKIDVAVSGRLNHNIPEIWGACSILIFTGGDPTDDANYWNLNPFGQFQTSGGATALGWAQFNGDNVDLLQWQTASFNDCLIPVNGILIIKLQAGFPPGDATEAHFRELRIGYKIFMGGGYFEAKGDYWLTEKNIGTLNITEDTVLISDAPRRILKGAMIFKNDTEDDLTTPGWYRFNTVSSPNPTSQGDDFKEILNKAKYNDQYRRFYTIRGSFDGLTFGPENNQLNKQPIGFHMRFRFEDWVPHRLFVIVPPLKMNFGTGDIEATFEEVYLNSGDGTQTGDSQTFGYSFE